MNLQLVFTDLDDTLFATMRKQAEPSACIPVSHDVEGRPSGLASPTQQALWQWLTQWGKVVPVTARMGGQLNRVSLPFADHAVWNHGATVRLHGSRDESWHARTMTILNPLQEVFRCLKKELATSGWPQTSLCEQDELDGCVGRLVLKEKGSTFGKRAEELRETVARCAPPGSLWVHVQRDNLVILPVGITKSVAVRHLIDVLRPTATATVGVGDSHSDVPFMRECDFCVFPRQAMALDAFGADAEDAR